MTEMLKSKQCIKIESQSRETLRSRGEIVSRKATDFDNIQVSTFENYLKEINNKYAPGTVIRSNKYPDIDGQPLQGKKVLEVPSSNQGSPKLEEFRQLAEEYGVELRFQSE